MVQVKSIEFRDYKAFGSFKISCRAKNVLVGPNNAGKSTALDALRVTFDILRNIRRRNSELRSHGQDGVCPTWRIPTTAVQTDLRYCVHNFGDGKAYIVVKLDNGNSLTIEMSNGDPLICYLKTEITPRINTSFLKDQFPLDLTIVPTLSPLEQNEELVKQETVDRNRFGRLASRNFRNFWLERTEQEFEKFADLVEIGWPGIRVKKPEIERGGGRTFVRMYFRDGPYVREVQWAGFGFQVWMQTMMHLLDSNHSTTLVLDEPDIYLHPDLQHRLLRLVSQRVGQYFIATHSTEIINDVDASEVLIVRPSSRSAKRLTGHNQFSDVYSAIGSSENAQFARLAKTKKVLFFEGNDARLLKNLSKKFCGNDFLSDGSVTLMKTSGFSNWNRVTTSSWVFKSFFGFDVPVAAVFDRDYRCDEEVNQFVSKVNTEETQCHVLPFKELENFLLVPRAIERSIRRHASVKLNSSWEDDLSKIFEDEVSAVKTRTLSARIAARIEFELTKNPKANVGSISSLEETNFSQRWENVQNRTKIVPGKAVFSAIARRVQDELKVSLSATRVAQCLEPIDIDAQFLTILRSIQNHLDV